MSESGKKPEQTSQPESLDENWYQRFQEVGAFQAYEYLNGDKTHRAEEKKAFLAGEKENPELDYPNIDQDRLAQDEAALLQLKTDILNQEQNEVVKKVYRWKINEKLAELRMLRAATEGDMRRFSRYSEFVYGKPSPEVFNYTVSRIHALIEETKEREDQELVAAAKDLEAVLLLDASTESVATWPSEELFSQASEMTKKQFSDVLDIPLGEEKLDALAIKEAFDAAFETLNMEESGWRVVVDSETSRTGISVKQESKTVVIPESRKDSAQKIQKLVLHEIGTHAARRDNGERSRLMLLGLGLDRYEQGEEGVATMREQVLGEEFKDYSGLEGHLAISLAKGVDGTERDFRQVFEVLKKYYYWNGLRLNYTKEQARADSDRLAWNRCVRTFRGTDSSTPGTCFTKDMIYREGNIGAWQAVDENVEEMQRFQVGKYDPANPRHLWVLETLAITDQDLDSIE